MASKQDLASNKENCAMASIKKSDVYSLNRELANMVVKVFCVGFVVSVMSVAFAGWVYGY
jgi:hypothetical protein